jgi:hypothetical protein
MLAHGTITAEMHDAGAAFRDLVRTAARDPLRPAPLERAPGGGGGGPTAAAELGLDARRRLVAALEALGGPGSAAGGCAWHVLGLGLSVREWAATVGWNGRPVGHAQAQGVLVAALGVLVALDARRRR